MVLFDIGDFDIDISYECKISSDENPCLEMLSGFVK